jgi:transcriptional regulator with XRE-family HTH domain
MSSDNEGLYRKVLNYGDKGRSAAAKELRRRLGLSQSTFGRRIGRTLNTVLRYESQIEPRGEALLPYAALAIQCGCTDLAEIFRDAIIEDFGRDLELVMSWQQGEAESGMHIPRDMRPLVEAFLEFMSAKSLQPAEELARNSLMQLLLNEYSTVGLRARKKGV